MANDNQNDLEWSEALQTYKDKTYSLKEALLRSVSYWAAKLTSNTLLVWDPERDSMVERPHPLYPEREELIQTCWIKISAARAAVETIWSAPEPDGFLGVCRYVSRVCTNALIDAHRRNEVRAAEIFAQNLDEPVRISEGEDGVNADSGTFADTIPDSDGIQPFQLDDLRGDLTDEEFSVLRKKIDGATQDEIAEDTGETVSQVSKAYRNAKSKARQWVNGLKNAPYHRTRARMCPRFTRNRCTRPDRLCGAELEAWNPANSRNVVEFHDESSAWRPAIPNQPRNPRPVILAERQECVRCKKKSLSLLIYDDGAILQRCESSCAYIAVWKAKQTRTEITSRSTGTFFMSDQTKKQYKLIRSEVVRFVRDNELVKQDLAAIANVPAARLSDYLHDKPISEEYAARIENAVAKIIYVWITFAPIKIALDDPQAFWKAVELADKTQAAQSAWEGYEAGHRMKQEHNEAAAD